MFANHFPLTVCKLSLQNSAKVPSALQTDVTGLDWFKIYEDGYGPGTQWAVDRLIANQGLVTFKIPECIPDGEYLLRVELIGMFALQLVYGANIDPAYSSPSLSRLLPRSVHICLLSYVVMPMDFSSNIGAQFYVSS